MKTKISIVILALLMISTMFMLTACGQYTVTFMDDDQLVAEQVVDKDNALTLPQPTKTGYTFAGWYDGDIMLTAETEVKQDTTVVAKWNINQYTVTFDSNGGSVVASIPADYNTTITLPTNPTKAEYVFGGWYLGEEQFTDKTAVTQNITLVAKWNINQYTVTFDSNGGSVVASIPVDYNTTITLPTNPTKAEYKFGGWYLGEEQFTDRTKVTQNITVIAKWNINQYTVTFDSAGGNNIASITSDAQSIITIPADPIRPDYDFVHWTIDGQPIDTPTLTLTKDTTIVAQWIEALTYQLTSDGTGYIVIDKGDFDINNTSLTLPATHNDKPIVKIDENVFENCMKLSTVTLPDSVISIGKNAFANTTWYHNQPNGVVYLGNVVYNYKGNMPQDTSITLKDGTVSISDSSFYYNYNMQDITMPDSVEYIGENAFYSCLDLATITFSNNIRYVGNNAFTHTPWLDNQPDGIVYASNVVYKYKGTIPADTVIELPEGTLGITERAFYNQNKLKGITIPNSVTYIDKDAFDGCSSLTSISLPFVGASVNATDNTHFGYIFGATSYTNNKTHVPKKLEQVTVTSGDTIADSAFNNCDSIATITLSNSITRIGNSAFYGCDNLADIVISDKTTDIGANAFAETKWYKAQADSIVYFGNIAYGYNGVMPNNASIQLKDGTLGILDKAFAGKTNLSSITIPSTLKNIGSQVFYGCDNLTSIIVDADNQYYKSIGGNLYSKDGTTLLQYALGKTDDTFAVPDSVTTIAKSAFADSHHLTTITLPDSVVTIGEDAFANCNMTSLTIPNSVTTIGKGALSNCNSLESLSIPHVGHDANTAVNSHFGYIFGADDYTDNAMIVPHSLTAVSITSGSVIANNAFDGCYELISIIISDTTVAIGEKAFYNCYNLTTMSVPDSVLTIGKCAYDNCSSLSEITLGSNIEWVGVDAFANTAWYDNLPNGLIYAGKVAYKYKGTTPDDITIQLRGGTLIISDNAFANCTNISTITLPKTLTDIGVNAFSGCAKLSSITISNTVKSIGDGAFSGCTTLSNIGVVGSNKHYSSIDGNLYNKTGTQLIQYAIGKTSTVFVIPNNVTSITKGALQDANNIIKLSIPFVGATLNGTTNTHFGYIFGAEQSSMNADYVSSSINEVVIAGGTSIENHAFNACKDIRTLYIAESIIYMNGIPFNGCYNIWDVYCEAPWRLPNWPQWEWSCNIQRYHDEEYSDLVKWDIIIDEVAPWSVG